MSNFESNLVGREINAIPPGIIHSRTDLPDNAAIYTIHTVYMVDGDEPQFIAELTDDEHVAEPDVLPKSIKGYVSNLDQLWNLLPDEDSDIILETDC